MTNWHSKVNKLKKKKKNFKKKKNIQLNQMAERELILNPQILTPKEFLTPTSNCSWTFLLKITFPNHKKLNNIYTETLRRFLKADV